MVDGLQIANGIVAALRADATLEAALGTQYGSPKVQIGSILPEGAGLPFVLVFDNDFTYDQNNQKPAGVFNQQIQVWTTTAGGGKLDNLDKVYEISRAIADVLEISGPDGGLRIESSALIVSRCRLLSYEAAQIVDNNATLKVLNFVGFASAK